MPSSRRELVHDLRSPLNSVLVLSRVLADNTKGNLDSEQIEYARTIHTAATRLLGVIEDMLATWRLEPTAAATEPEPAPAAPAIASVVELPVPELDGATVIVVAEDIRTIFEITGVLERQRARVLFAESARAAAALLDGADTIHAIVIDPALAGGDAVVRDRRQPVVELTAPVDLSHLLEGLRACLRT